MIVRFRGFPGHVIKMRVGALHALALTERGEFHM